MHQVDIAPINDVDDEGTNKTNAAAMTIDGEKFGNVHMNPECSSFTTPQDAQFCPGNMQTVSNEKNIPCDTRR